MSEHNLQYTVKILEALQELINSDESLQKDLQEDEKATQFLYSLSCVVPARFYTQFTGDEQDILGVNHIANRLCFQFGKSEEDTETK